MKVSHIFYGIVGLFIVIGSIVANNSEDSRSTSSQKVYQESSEDETIVPHVANIIFGIGYEIGIWVLQTRPDFLEIPEGVTESELTSALNETIAEIAEKNEQIKRRLSDEEIMEWERITASLKDDLKDDLMELESLEPWDSIYGHWMKKNVDLTIFGLSAEGVETLWLIAEEQGYQNHSF